MDKIFEGADGITIKDVDGHLFLICKEDTYGLSSYSPEPCLYIEKPDGSELTIHDFLDVKEIYDSVKTGKKTRTITGHEYDLEGLCRLMLFAVNDLEGNIDIGYLEGRMFVDVLEENEAYSEQSAVDLGRYGLINHRIMDGFIHSKRIKRTDDGRYYVVKGYR
ncbi:MAG: hypothetical protein J5796_01325 [Erysipelotrichaceae bacterium]|nr:hypothetical protein [Erysipelotrichaceae bacterium]